MALLIPPAEIIPFGLRAIKTVATVDGPLDETQRAILSAAQTHILHTTYDIDQLESITPNDLAQHVTDTSLRRQLLQTMALITLAGRDVSPQAAHTIESFGKAFGLDEAAVRHVREYSEQHIALLRFDFIRHSFQGDMIRNFVAENGKWAMVRALASLSGVVENPTLASKYHALKSLPDGTLGKELWQFYTAHKFPFPGEKGGAPEALIPHDLTHVLGGYETDFVSEGRVLAFQAGYKKQDPLSLFLFIVLQAHNGVKLTFLAERGEGILARPGIVEQLAKDYLRGAQMNIDLLSDWHWRDALHEPVYQLRQRFNIVAQETAATVQSTSAGVQTAAC